MTEMHQELVTAISSVKTIVFNAILFDAGKSKCDNYVL